MRTIVILTDQLHKIGGINSLIQLKANFWTTDKGYEIHIVTTEQGSKTPFYTFDSKVNFHDLNINYNRNKSYFSRSNFFKVIKNLISLRSLLKKIKPDLIIIANHIPATLFFTFLGTKAKILKEYHYTQYFQSKKKPTIFKKLEKSIESKLDFQVVLNREEIAFYNSDRVHCIPNPIAFSTYADLRLEGRENIAIAAGRISPVKRFDVLLDIWAEFKKTGSSWKLEIYGEGLDADIIQLKEQIQKLGITESVKVLDPVNNLPEIMKSKGMYLMTSGQECFPMVLLEAQASGLPIISYDCPTGPRNIIETGRNGILVEMDNQMSYVNAMVEITINERLRLDMAINGFNSVQQYQLEKVMEIWENSILKWL